MHADLTRLLGATPVVAEPAQDEERRGVEPSASGGRGGPKSDRAARAGEGVALIEVDGVVRTVRVGAKVDGELRLLRVDARSASLGVDGQAPTQVLQMQAQTAPATGNLAPAAPSATVLGGEASAGDPSAPAPGANAAAQSGSVVQLSVGNCAVLGSGGRRGGPHCSRCRSLSKASLRGSWPGQRSAGAIGTVHAQLQQC